jgi:hypothetical protein
VNFTGHVLIGIAAVALVAGAMPAAACQGGPERSKQMSGPDHFKPDESRFFADGVMHLRVPKNASTSWWAQPSHLSDAAVFVCAELWFPQTAEVVNGGVMFWVVNPQAYYIARVGRDGSAGIFAHTSAGWSSEGVFLHAPLIKPGIAPAPQARNVIEVMIIRNQAQVFVNDRRVMALNCCRPKVPWQAGVYAEAESTKDTEWLFANAQDIELPVRYPGGPDP